MNWLMPIAAVILAGFFLTEKETADVGPTNFTRFDSLFRKYGLKYNVPWRWLKAIAMNESSLGENALVKAGLPSWDLKSYGLMQVTLKTAQSDLDPDATPEKLNDPDYSVRLAAIYIRRLMLMFSGDKRKTVMSYNQGPGNTMNGKEYAAEYFERFQRNLARIMVEQPGNEKELS